MGESWDQAASERRAGNVLGSGGSSKSNAEGGRSKVKDFLEYLFERLKDKRPVTHTVKGQEYAVKQNGEIGAAIRELEPQWNKPTLVVSTLQGLVDAYAAKIDGLDPEKVAIRIVSHLQVQVVDKVADEFGRRHVYIAAGHLPDTKFVFGQWYEPEDFLIAFRSSFFFNEEAVTRSSIELPADGISLIPWRTFRDANPVVSRFLLRMRGVKDGLPKIALFEIDAKWQLDTVASLRSWIENDIPGVTVIA
jgi:hypothetical protein